MLPLDDRVKHVDVGQIKYSTTGYKGYGRWEGRDVVTFDVLVEPNQFLPNNLSVAQAQELVAALQHSIKLIKEQ